MRPRVRTLDALEPAVFPTQLSYADNGKLVYAILNRNSDAVVWDAVNGKFIRRLDLPHRNPNAFSAVALYKNWFARNNYDHSGHWIGLWDLEQAKIVKLPVPDRETEPLRFSADGRFLLVTLENRIYVWQVSTGQLALVTKNTFDVDNLALSSDGKTLATVKSGKVTLWDVSAATTAVMAAKFTPTAPLPTKTPFIFDYGYPTSTPQPTLSITLQPAGEISANAISVSNAFQVHQQAQLGIGRASQIAWEGSHIYVTGAPRSHPLRNGIAHGDRPCRDRPDAATSSRVLPDGRILAASNTDGKVQLWEMSGPGLESKKMLLEDSGSSPTAISPGWEMADLLHE